jgi:hypothetical protein
MRNGPPVGLVSRLAEAFTEDKERRMVLLLPTRCPDIQDSDEEGVLIARPIRPGFQSFDGVSFEPVFVADRQSARPMLKGENRFQFVPTPVTSTSFIHMRMDTRMKSSCSRSSNARDILDSRSRRLHDAYANHDACDIDPQGPRTMKSR